MTSEAKLLTKQNPAQNRHHGDGVGATDHSEHRADRSEDSLQSYRMAAGDKHSEKPQETYAKRDGDKKGTDKAPESLPSIELTGAIKPANAEEARRLQDIQVNLSLFVARYQSVAKPGDHESTTPQAKPGESANEPSLLKGIDEELRRGEMGPNTRKALQLYIKSLADSGISGTIQDLKKVGIETVNGPDGKPLSVPSIESLKSIRTDSIPGKEQMTSLDRASQWIVAAGEAITLKPAQDMKEAIEKSELPKGWQEGYDKDPLAWQNKVFPFVMLAGTAKNMVDSMEYLALNSNGEYKMQLPEGAQARRDEKGNLLGVKFDLPENLDMSNPENLQKYKKILDWYKKHEGAVTRSMMELTGINKNPASAIYWGDVDMPGGKAKLDSDGKFIGFFDPKNPELKPGEAVKDFNLLEKRFSVEERDGKIIVKQHTQPQAVPIWGYQNLIYGNVGAPMKSGEKSFAPDDMVPVFDGNKLQFVKAKDLSWHMEMQRAMHYGGKALMIGLDASLCVTGSAGLVAAYRGARMLQAGVRTGVALTNRQLGARALYSGAHLAVGATGVFSNAGAREVPGMGYLETGRHAVILADAARNVALFGLRSASNSSRIVRRASRGDITTETMLRGVSPRGKNIFAEPMAIRPYYHGAQKTATLAQILAAPLVGKSLYDDVTEK